jgi:hypothetical protein
MYLPGENGSAIPYSTILIYFGYLSPFAAAAAPLRYPSGAEVLLAAERIPKP